MTPFVGLAAFYNNPSKTAEVRRSVEEKSLKSVLSVGSLSVTQPKITLGYVRT